MASTTAQEQQQQQQQLPALKCPRCDSSNTKFCYYNNYSLSQPRHFCKSCKRYWTRGGTLRNVPVGGGCRKNKRLRRPSGGSGIDSATPPQSSSSSAVLAAANPSPSVLPQIELNPIFYGLPTSAPEFNFSGRFSDLNYELDHGVSGLGFSSDSSNPILGSSSSSAATPTIASLLASTFQSQKLVNKTASSRPGSFQGLGVPFQQQDQIQASRENSSNFKVEEGKYWNNISGCQNPVEQQVGFSDPFMFWNMTNTSSTVGASQFLL